jgi:hypothetical protein
VEWSLVLEMTLKQGGLVGLLFSTRFLAVGSEGIDWADRVDGLMQ